MECNRDEAARAKQIAENKFLSKDFSGAKKFAIKAHNLYPELDGIAHMLATLNVYVSADNKINGEPDWYGILGVSPHADEDTLRKQYRKLALLLHPDKNKAKGADGAFNLILQAWSLLSDKAKRSVYDQKRKAKRFKHNVQHSGGGSQTPPGQNGFYNFKEGASSNMKPPKDKCTSAPSSHNQKPASAPASSHKEKPAPVPPSHKQKPSTVPASSCKQKPPNAHVTSHKRKHFPTSPHQSQEPKQTTFWTACHRCKMQYEYPRIYVNRNLLCPNCHDPFFSFETPPPQPAKRECSAHQRVSKNNTNAGVKNSPSADARSGGLGDSNSSKRANFHWTPFSKTAGAASAAQAASMVHQAYEKVKRERQEAQAATKKDEALRTMNHAYNSAGGISSYGSYKAAKRKRDMDIVGAGGDAVNLNSMEHGAGNLSGLRQLNLKQLKICKTIRPCTTGGEVSDVKTQQLLSQKARMEILNKLNEWNFVTMAKSAVGEREKEYEKTDEKEKVYEKAEVKEKGKDPRMVDGAKRQESVSCKQFNGRKENHSHDSNPSNSDVVFARMPMSMEVPDSEFHDFDRCRTEICFGENQVWAAYDNDDGMPRYYAMIHHVICLNPFKIRISWLDSRTNNDLGSLNWISSGFSKTCGNFRFGKQEISDSLNSFSHKVRWTEGSVGNVQIYPGKGDVWSLYRCWSPEWNELTADEVIHQYDIVEVLDDYDEEQGVTVAPLVKVAGFRTVFHRRLDPRDVQRIPREEIFRFSHYIPSYLITGQETPNAPRGCHELDPAATPAEFLHVIADVNDNAIMENGEECHKELILDDVGNSNIINAMEQETSEVVEQVLEKSNIKEEKCFEKNP